MHEYFNDNFQLVVSRIFSTFIYIFLGWVMIITHAVF